ncbi:1,6-dihydroxycyclohexa-2,4-diene-1-carboxylate dehydrogenase [Pseudoalteromonas sp. BSi20311]|jgi:dihydroxycyclohexadiene carboxylate dehydrogenase|uniref:1,6-dihydroxycyclohexa-2,4-diene-1-carboxylate dehydrogenase n=1 Tax=unclassified Pseudoalteromonas TaxID=194690 RepID=UPI0002318C3F|nr:MULTISPECIES: 1,6-dihydroxycyclohexa-2,4-diene-1-carboxylate dehydrogenase [unclassified Pseudoalteromonas]GAA62434.1 1,6-dihydroxycyclohexa-2,4-diene-1-carboxylate dehydrogenase [Pseudoalteromonas sp. BSi20311]|tara:strand:+ start:3551 stop:4330 length:780 start_codon:yes stop_codon:yes gene_type:complete
MSNRFDDKVMVVTGAAQGIGLTVATRAATEGAKLVIVDQSDHVFKIAEILKSRGTEVVAVVSDLETAEGAQQAIDAAINSFGRLDILINNVGGTIWMQPYASYTPEQIQKEVQRSLFPTLWCCHAALPAMLNNKRGAIVNVSSVATRGINRVPYSAAKGGVNALTVSLAFEYAQHNIRVNATAPGGTEAPPRVTPRNTDKVSEEQEVWYDEVVEQTKETSFMHRYGTLEEQTAAILFLASDEASYITGSILPVAGGDCG